MPELTEMESASLLRDLRKFAFNSSDKFRTDQRRAIKLIKSHIEYDIGSSALDQQEVNTTLEFSASRVRSLAKKALYCYGVGVTMERRIDKTMTPRARLVLQNELSIELEYDPEYLDGVALTEIQRLYLSVSDDSPDIVIVREYQIEDDEDDVLVSGSTFDMESAVQKMRFDEGNDFFTVTDPEALPDVGAAAEIYTYFQTIITPEYGPGLDISPGLTQQEAARCMRNVMRQISSRE